MSLMSRFVPVLLLLMGLAGYISFFSGTFEPEMVPFIATIIVYLMRFFSNSRSGFKFNDENSF
jgi:hypothetical protein